MNKKKIFSCLSLKGEALNLDFLVIDFIYDFADSFYQGIARVILEKNIVISIIMERKSFQFVMISWID
ncbi:hypothetical protein [Dapis sp. BLCC M172]|uniref:hypothetical protein n=1 Tax=Dapis sp. BLCC M172 TaxID=2975281 RepID=UPI003CF00F86